MHGFLVLARRMWCHQIHFVEEGTFDGMEVYTTKVPERAFEEIRYIEIQRTLPSNPKLMLDQLVEMARNEGTDGLVNVRFTRIEKRNIVSGTSIKFKETSQ
ncbi:hypothetical protein [Pararhodonellum marinum]|uniref:hypothetical protein n=1 Tax=Pararhodonellum marinum TaxID=2755358 RepID=UPI00188F5BD6|nr:hypothetical protein [Pararhodonellum marinum]